MSEISAAVRRPQGLALREARDKRYSFVTVFLIALVLVLVWIGIQTI